FSLADVNLNFPPETPVAVVPLEKRANPDLIAAALGMGIYHAEKLPGRRVVAAGSKAALRRLGQLKPADRPELAKAFAAAWGLAVQVLFIPTADMRRVIEELLPTLPEEVGSGSGKTLTRGGLWAALELGFLPRPVLKLTVQSQDAAAARALRD